MGAGLQVLSKALGGGGGSPGTGLLTHFPWGYSVRFAKAEDDKGEEDDEENPLLVPLEEKGVLKEEQASLWFSKVRGSQGVETQGIGISR